MKVGRGTHHWTDNVAAECIQALLLPSPTTFFHTAHAPRDTVYQRRYPLWTSALPSRFFFCFFSSSCLHAQVGHQTRRTRGATEIGFLICLQATLWNTRLFHSFGTEDDRWVEDRGSCILLLLAVHRSFRVAAPRALRSIFRPCLREVDSATH